MKTMQHNIDNIASVTLGVIIGTIKYSLNIHLPIEFASKLLEGAVTAGVCGFFSWGGKELWLLVKKSFIEYFKTRKSKINGKRKIRPRSDK